MPDLVADGEDNVLLVWDDSGTPEALDAGLVVQAARYDPPAGGVSLPRYLDDHGDALRAAYIAFVHDLGRQQVHGKTVSEMLADRDGFSYWWMSHLAEKSPFKSPRIHDCLRLMAFEQLLQQHAVRFKRLTLCGGDRLIARTLATWCARHTMDFTHTGGMPIVRAGPATRVHALLPWRLKGAVSLRHWLRKWPLRGLSAPQWFSQPRGLLFGSYFFNLDGKRADDGQFYSRQWEQLPESLHRDGWSLNWLHHMLLLPGIRSVRDGLQKAYQFNADHQTQGCHSFVESQLGLGVLARALMEWSRIGHRATVIRPHLSFTPTGSRLDLWHLLEEDWETSFRGAIGLANCIWRRLFDRALSAMPAQAAGFYLWENQGWECAFIHAWRRHQRTPLIGVPHATTAFWHLNNFDDPRLFGDGDSPTTKPLPDLLAVNGPMAWRMFSDSGYPAERMAPVEASRFFHLMGAQNRATTTTREPGATLKVLMLGDFSRKQCRAMGLCLGQAARLWGGHMELTVKPHPITSLDERDLPGLSFVQSSSPLGDILPGFDLAFASNSSSAALDAWLHGVPVAVFLDDSSLNHSPMRAAPGACFVSSSAQLAQVLSVGVPHPPMATNDFFWLDEDMRRWRQLVSQVAITAQPHRHTP